jgi:hypothetical protein
MPFFCSWEKGISIMDQPIQNGNTRSTRPVWQYRPALIHKAAHDGQIKTATGNRT